MSQDPSGGLAAELSSLRTFKGRVDELLTTLGDSEAAPERVADARLTGAHLGTGFNAAHALYGAYNDVHQQLESLAKLLSDQIEFLSMAVHGAGTAYADTDDDQRARMWEIQNRVKQQYDPARDPYAAPPTASSGGKGRL
ncbi:hypothetical protein ACH427_06615 [Streptomyces sp. NPDC020379]|uniref:hypothetical protein n=1 Tax=Streptomyces sp. NPDC020379 TaxID=3365071 RepID=UPI003795E0A3